MLKWCDPDGYPHHVQRENLADFCRLRKLKVGNMIHHIDTPTSDQKHGGWRLIERLVWISRANDLTTLVPALGTSETFFKSCACATDGRHILTEGGKFVKTTFNKFLCGSYNNGQPWKGWQVVKLSVHDAEERLCRLQSLPPPVPISLPDFGVEVCLKHKPALACVRALALVELPCADAAFSPTLGSLPTPRVPFRAFSSRATR